MWVNGSGPRWQLSPPEWFILHLAPTPVHDLTSRNSVSIRLTLRDDDSGASLEVSGRGNLRVRIFFPLPPTVLHLTKNGNSRSFREQGNLLTAVLSELDLLKQNTMPLTKTPTSALSGSHATYFSPLHLTCSCGFSP